VVLGAFGEVETALTNEGLLAERLRDDQAALGNRTEAVRLGQIRYTAGASDLLTLLILQREQIASQSNVIRLRGAQLANRIDLHLALGGVASTPPRRCLRGPRCRRCRRTAARASHGA
jgi:multidrug efflux system outer membrane protein